ncbi:outer membrane beta-barrel protein [Wenyingzhuangia sp. IMCC45467]
MKKIILSAMMLTGMLTFAQEGKLTVSGTVDVYGTVNTVDGPGAPGLLVDTPENATMFGLGMANTIFAYESGKAGAVVDLAYGPRSADASGWGGIVNQMYAYYSINDALTVTAGQFNTFLGYEVISPASNFNYTVSYLFNAGPFTHVGAKIDYAASEDLSFMLAITNPHGNFGTGYGDDYAQLGFQVGFKGQYLNIAYGADGFGASDQLYIDYTGGFDIASSTYLGINAAYSSSSDLEAGYQGVALYLQQAISDSFSLGLRPEYFALNGDANADEAVTAITLTANTTLTENLSVIADLRVDSSDDMMIEGSAEDSLTQFTVAAVYSF